MAELRNSGALEDKEVRDTMIAALCCVVPFLCKYVTNATTPSIIRMNI